MAKKGQTQDMQLDLVAPFVEIFHEICVLLVVTTGEVVKFLWSKYGRKKNRVERIDSSVVDVKKVTDDPNALGMDLKKKKVVRLDQLDFSKHTFIVGASGFGKTNLISVLQENALKRGRPVIFFDPKGDYETLMSFQSLCSKYGRKCRIFSEFHPDSIRLNPVLEGTINQITDRIMCAFDWSEQYYKDASRRALMQTLKSLRKNNVPVTLKSIYQELERGAEDKDSVGLLVKLESIVESDFGKKLEQGRDTYTFSEIREERSCLYIGLSTQGYGETAMAIGKIFLEELLYNSYITLKDHKRLGQAKQNPISVYFDEFGALVTPKFIELQNKCRGAGIELTMAVQTPADIDRINSTLTRQIMENAMNIFIMKQRIDQDATLLSKTIGTIQSKKMTYMTEDGRVQNKGSLREVNEMIAHPDLIKNLKVGQCVLLTHNPTRVHLMNLRFQKKIDEEVEEKIERSSISIIKSGARGRV